MKRKTTRALPIIITALFVASFSPFVSGHASAADEREPQINRTVVMSGLSEPWDLAFASDGAMLFTEKCRGLSVRTSDGAVRRLFGPAGSALEADDFFCQGQSGMLGLALDPAFEENRCVYVYMASNMGKAKTNRVVRLSVNTAYTAVADRKDIVTDIPFKEAFNRWGRAGAHSGGRIRFSPFNIFRPGFGRLCT